jgi:branched-chain amino acid transport system permease protein
LLTVELLTSGLVLSVLYSLEALSFVLIIRGTGVLNFALGEMLVLGPYLFASMGGNHSQTAVLGLAGTIVAACLVGAVLYRQLLRRLVGHQIWAMVISLFAVADIMQAAIQLIWGSSPRALTPFAFHVTQPVPGVRIDNYDLSILIGGVVVIAAVFILTYGTRLGLHMRACAEDSRLAAYRGIHVRRVATISWCLGTALAFLAGIALALRTQLSPSLSDGFLTAFPAVLIGGFESLVGAVVGSIVLAFLSDSLDTYVGGQYSVPAGYALLLLMILVRPYGLFGSRSEVRV